MAGWQGGMDLSRDFLVWDNREDVTYVSHATAGDTSYSLTSPDGKGGVKRRNLTWKELTASAGVYTTQDRAWLLPVANLPPGLTPKPADRIIDGQGNSWTVLEAPLNTWGTWYKLVTRNLVIQANLKDRIDIQRPAITLDAANVTIRAWPPAGGTTPYAALSCRIQELTAEIANERDLRGFRRTHEIYLSQQVSLQSEDRILVTGGTTIYAIRGYHSPNRIDELPVIDAELVP